jgi:NAD(P)-dependent dehydrogenase (short-subunit alcohol dehydrogenase family)
VPDRIALITGANQGVGKQVAKELAEHGVTVLIGSRDLRRGEEAAAEIGLGTRAVQIDVTDLASIAGAAAFIEREFGRLDLLVSNAGISSSGGGDATPEERAARSTASTASLDEVRAVWDVNVFGVLAVYQAMLPLLRKGVDARIVNVSSGVGSLTSNADPSYPLAMMVELESTDIKINLVSPAYTSTALNNFSGTESIEDGSREVVRVALLGPDGPTGTFTRWENSSIPW